MRLLKRTAPAIIMMMLALPAKAHTEQEAIEWTQEWSQRVHAHGFSIALMSEYLTFHLRHSHEPAPKPSYEDTGDWRPLVAVHFYPEDVDTAMRILWCESRGDANAKNPTSTASGLFQHLRYWWSGQSAYPAFNPFDPNESVRAAAYLRYRNGDWSDWNASKHCWGR